MRFLIDGYNLMHALGVMAGRFGPDGLRRARDRFLDRLSRVLGPEDSSACTVVFDAASAPAGLGREARHQGLTVLYAVDEADADERIEQLIAQHSAPKALTVVSSDLRLRKAAKRRRASAVTSDAFALRFTDGATRVRPIPPTPASATLSAEPARSEARDAGEDRRLLEVFGHLDTELAGLEPQESAGLTDREITRIRREVEEEFRRGEEPRPGHRRRRSPGRP